MYESSEEYIHELRRQIDKVHDLARENLKVSSSNQKRQYDHRSKEIGFSEGDLVWYYCPARKKGLSPKLQKNWSGPYSVTRRISDILYEIKRSPPRTRSVVVHCDKLRKYSNQIQTQSGTENSNSQDESECLRNDVETDTRSGRKVKRPQWYGISQN